MAGKNENNWLYNKTLLAIADLRILFLVISLLIIVIGFLNLGRWDVQSHEEQIVYSDYQDELQPGMWVKIDAVEAEVLTYTSTTDTKTTRIGNTRYKIENVTYYAYVLLSAEDGKQAVAVWESITVNSQFGYETLQKFCDEIDDMAGKINRAGLTIYGVTTENNVAKQDPEYYASISTGILTSASLDNTAAIIRFDENRDRAALYGAFSVYADMPETRTVIDSREFRVNPVAVVILVAGVVLLLFAVFLICFRHAHEKAEIYPMRTEGAASAGRISKLAAEKAHPRAVSSQSRGSTAQKTGTAPVSVRTAAAAAEALAKKEREERMAREYQETENRLKEEKQKAVLERQMKERQAAEAKKRAMEQTSRGKAPDALVSAIPPVGRSIASQKGQQQLFDYAAAVIPELAVCKEPPHQGARLFTEKLDDPDTLLDVVSEILTDTALIIEKADLTELSNVLWPALDHDTLLKAYKAFGVYAELSVGNEDFEFMKQIITELLQKRQVI